jgi:hypothetical protein
VSALRREAFEERSAGFVEAEARLNVRQVDDRAAGRLVDGDRGTALALDRGPNRRHPPCLRARPQPALTASSFTSRLWIPPLWRRVGNTGCAGFMPGTKATMS